MEVLDLFTRNIFLIGSSTKGPVNYPVKVNSVEYAKQVFGPRGDLIDAVSQLIDMEVPCNLWLIKGFGRHSEVYLNVLDESGEILLNGFHIKSKHADDMCNNIQVFVDDNQIAFKLGGYSCKEVSYNLHDYSTLVELAKAINEDTKNNLNEVICTAFCDPSTSCDSTLAPANYPHHQLTGGSSGLEYNINQKYIALDEVYSTLEGQFVDFIVPLGVYYDNTKLFTTDQFATIGAKEPMVEIEHEYDNQYKNFHNQMIRFCVDQMQHGFVTHGLLGITPRAYLKTRDEHSFLRGLECLKEVNYIEEELRRYSMLTSIVTSDMWYHYGTVACNGVIPYLALLSKTAVNQTTTNLEVTEKFLLIDRQSSACLDKVADLGFVAFRYSPRKHLPVVYKGVTTSYDSEYSQVENVRTFQFVARAIRTFLDNYVGQNIEDAYFSGHLEESLTNTLIGIKTLGLITGINTVSLEVKDNSHLIIDIDLVGIHTINSIKLANSVILDRRV